MNPILSAFLGSAITSVTSIITIILTNRHNTRIVEKQIKSTENQVRLQYRYEDDKIVKNLNYQNKVELIDSILLIQTKNNLTKNYIMEISNANQFVVNKKYEDIVKVANKVITKLYLSFPDYVEYGYKIRGKCNEIWGNEQNYFGYQSDKPKAQADTKQKLIELYKELNELCITCLDFLKESKDYN